MPGRGRICSLNFRLIGICSPSLLPFFLPFPPSTPQAIVSPSASLPSLPVRSPPTGEGGTEVPGVERGGGGVGEGMVAIEMYDRLTRRAGGLYEFFQEEADPGT
jgi:hypothetical protein